MQRSSQTAAAVGADYSIDVRSRHRALTSDVAHFLITGSDDLPVAADRALRVGVTRAEPLSAAGVWVATATTSREPSTVTMTLAASGRDVGGSVHFGPPAFDVTLPVIGRLTANRLTASLGGGDGMVTFSGTLGADGRTLEGPVVYAGRVLYTLRLARR